MSPELSQAPQRIGDTVDLLGEVPFWSAEERSLYWIDVRRSLLRRRHEGGATEAWAMPELIGSFALADDGRVLVALASRLCLFDPAGGTFEDVAAPHAGRGEMRFNDGKCDRQGRFFVGSMHDVERSPTGFLYRLDHGGCTPVLDEVAVPNSLAWSCDGTTMYFSDGREPVIWAFPYDPRTGDMGERREFASASAGVPDGATVDAEDCLWSAHYGGGAVVRYRPDGSVDRRIEMPVTQPTSCAFGGPGLDVLFITSAAQRLSPEALAAQPEAGALFAIRPGVRGVPEPKFTMLKGAAAR
jgi:L-arabinonolactonase